MVEINILVALSAVIAVCALISVLYGIIHLSLVSVKKDIKRLDAGQARLESLLKEILHRQPSLPPAASPPAKS